jgi:hypothetical protein
MQAGHVHGEGKVGSTRRELDCEMKTLRQPRTIVMETTTLTGWICDHLLPHAERIRVAHPLMLRAICMVGAAEQKGCTVPADLHDHEQPFGFLSCDWGNLAP